MSENFNAPVGSKNWYEMENDRLKQQLATVTAQRDRAWAALQFITKFGHTSGGDKHAQAIAEARENGDEKF